MCQVNIGKMVLSDFEELAKELSTAFHRTYEEAIWAMEEAINIMSPLYCEFHEPLEDSEYSPKDKFYLAISCLESFGIPYDIAKYYVSAVCDDDLKKELGEGNFEWNSNQGEDDQLLDLVWNREDDQFYDDDIN